MKDQLKWVLNHMPKSDDQHLDVMSLPNVAKARSFHGSFPQYSITLWRSWTVWHSIWGWRVCM